MSYDIWLTADVGGEERAHLGPDWNYTSNVAPMWRKAMPETNGLAGLHEMVAEEAAQVLHKGVERMESNPAAYRLMNPENGWGNFDDQLRELYELLGACEAAPKAIVEVCR